MKTIHIKLLILTLFILSVGITFGQAAPPPPPIPTVGVPFGAIEFLLLGLGGYALKKIKTNK